MFNQSEIGVVLSILLDDDTRLGKTEFLKAIREKYEEMEPHFDKEYPDELLRVQHPGEESWMKGYRMNRWTGLTTTSTGRIYTSLQKIEQADDFTIYIESDPVKTRIIEQNSFAQYLTFQVPKFTSLRKWLFQVGLKDYLKDANAIVLILPDLENWIKTHEPLTVDQLAKPYPQIYDSDDIIYKAEKACIVELEKWKDAHGVKRDQFLAVSSTGVIHIRQVSDYIDGLKAFEVFDLNIELRDYPGFDLGSVICEVEDGKPVFDSVIQMCVPAWNEVLFRHSDLIINWALHGNPQKWEIIGKKCKTCGGVGKVYNDKNELSANCGQCSGSGVSKGSPFGVVEIDIQQPNATNPGVTSIPTPPVGYAVRDTESLKAQKEDINDNLYLGFQAVGLELLANVPAPQSGIAKTLDRKEINTFFFQVAIHLKHLYLEAAKAMYDQRYTALGLFQNNILTPEAIQESIPQITVPSDFDVLTTDVIAGQLSQAKKDGYNPIITSGLEFDYTEKLYGENSTQIQVMKAINALDPLPFKTADEKLILKDSMGCTELDYVTSAYIATFVNELIEADPKWVMKPRKEQRADVKNMALAKVQEIKAGIVPIMP